MRASSPFVVLTALLAACTPAIEVDDPPPPANAASRIIVVEIPAATPTPLTSARLSRMWAYADDDLKIRRAFALPEGAKVTFFYYAVPLEMFFIPSGELKLSDDARAGVVFPPSSDVFEGVLHGSSLPWTKVQSVDPIFAAIGFERSSPESCLSHEGCLIPDPASQQFVCAMPCPAIAAPDRPNAAMSPHTGSVPALGAAGCGTCADLATSRTSSCPSGQADFFTGCAPWGDPCPAAGEFPPAPTDPCVLYVSRTAGVLGCASRCSAAAPCASIAQALTCANPTCPSERTLLLGFGTFLQTSTVSARGSTRVFGACNARTTIMGGLTFEEGQNEVRDVRITAAFGTGLTVLGSADVAVRGVLFDLSGRTGISVQGGTVRTSSTVFRSALRGVGAERGAIALADVLFEDTASAAVALSGPGSAGSVERMAIRRAMAAAESQPISGVSVSRGASLVMNQAAIEKMRTFGLVVSGAGSTAVATHLAVRDMAATDTRVSTAAVAVYDGASLDLSDAVIEHAEPAAILIRGARSHAEVARADVIAALEQSAAKIGIDVRDGASAHAKGVIVSGGFVDDAAADGPGSTLLLEDVELKDSGRYMDLNCPGAAVHVLSSAKLAVTRGMIDGNACLGLRAESGGSASLSSVLFDAGKTGAVSITGGADAQFDGVIVAKHAQPMVLLDAAGLSTFNDLRICDQVSLGGDVAFSGGNAMLVQRGSRMVVNRLTVEDHLVLAGEATTATISDLHIDVEADPHCTFQTQTSSRGVVVEEGASLVIDRGVLVSAGIVVTHGASTMGSHGRFVDLDLSNLRDRRGITVQDGASVSLSRIQIAGGFPEAVFAGDFLPDKLVNLTADSLQIVGLADNPRSSGLHLETGATVRVTKFLINEDPSGSEGGDRGTTGVLLASPKVDVRLSQGQFVRNATAILLPSTSFDVFQLLEQVTFSGNGADLRTGM